jgi:hypothetical protein
VRVARRLPQLPLIHAAFARGELSYSKLRALTRIAHPATEEDLLTMGRALTASQLERAGARAAAGHEEANDLHDGAFLTTCWNEDGSLAIHARLAPKHGAVLLRALAAARDQLWAGKGAVPRNRPQAAVAPKTARRLACAASEVTMSERNGRRARRPSRRLRHRRSGAACRGKRPRCRRRRGTPAGQRPHPRPGLSWPPPCRRRPRWPKAQTTASAHDDRPPDDDGARHDTGHDDGARRATTSTGTTTARVPGAKGVD